MQTINLNLEANDEDMAFKYGLQDLSEWRCYELIENPGFFVIPNPFRPGYQRFLVKKCLSEYHNQPNKTNLDLHMKREGINLWKEALRLVEAFFMKKKFFFIWGIVIKATAI